MSRFWKSITAFLLVIAVIHVYEKIFGPTLTRKPEGSPRQPSVPCSSNESNRNELRATSRVLVTGGAGFIGMSLMARLARASHSTIRPEVLLGLDNFNNYYSPAYKRARADHLKEEHNLQVLEGDVCNASLLEDVFSKFKFTHVVHLAAQAGVRYSLDHPLSYVRNNLECFVTLVEQIRKIDEKNRPSFVYASSSSVYGLNRKTPFSEAHPVTKPANLYGATKFMNEQIASAFHHIYNLNSVGLRFFTVYGPWGRPDMAAFLFTRAIEKGEPVVLYNKGEMQRDFTYIDDIVAGIIASMQFCTHSSTVFNLGNEHPVELMKFIAIIEKEMGYNAKFKFKESPGEIKTTFADIAKAKDLLGYSPRTSIETGLKNFIDWYKNEPRRHVFALGDFNPKLKR
ncbi:hypothetical protein CTAYLR_004258 [Chrysophaeum taylorii]|uniref:NAD(P)-binding domain-containing protein n=1 Tax=Chrysophaeum taylorii TaxID=2483200 RepID=A0AAD7UG03_9STRA|nr:hypothetical protein CTAYLR_004258 [Chrysophaeum taylorii]